MIKSAYFNNALLYYLKKIVQVSVCQSGIRHNQVKSLIEFVVLPFILRLFCSLEFFLLFEQVCYLFS